MWETAGRGRLQDGSQLIEAWKHSYAKNIGSLHWSTGSMISKLIVAAELFRLGVFPPVTVRLPEVWSEVDECK